MFKESYADMNLLISCYMYHCVDNIIPENSVKVSTNNKPRITKSLKVLLKERQHAFQV